MFFAVDSHLLSSEALAQLARQVAWLRRNPNASILVAGNCDERGTREYNLALGARRADSVRAVLIAHGIHGFGHFAKAYARRYGHAPSVTARQAP